jgi:hypothetical protein
MTESKSNVGPLFSGLFGASAGKEALKQYIQALRLDRQDSADPLIYADAALLLDTRATDWSGIREIH